jgi:hypothetical protein
MNGARRWEWLSREYPENVWATWQRVRRPGWSGVGMGDARAEGSGPVGFDFDCSLLAGGVVVEAAPRIKLRRSDKTTLDGVAVDVADDVGALVLAAEGAVVVTDLPELLSVAFELSGGLLLEGLEEERDEDRRRLVHEQVDVLGHDDIGVDTGLMTGTGLLQLLLDEGFRVGIGEEWETVETAEGDEVESFGLLISF